MKIRIKFRKYGTMKFIGHLDIMHYFQKAIRRADADVRYSGGFSSHQIMSLATPLGVGITNSGEYVDIEATSTKGSGIMKRCLNEVMSEGFEIVGYRILPDDTVNTMSIVGAEDYTLTSRPGYEPEDMDKKQWFQGLIAFLERPSIMVTKQIGHRGREMDLKPLVYRLSIYPKRDGEMGGPRLFMKISAGSAVSVKPEQVLDAYYGLLGKERLPFAFMVQREEVYTDRASEAGKEAGIHSFISLGQLDEEIR